MLCFQLCAAHYTLLQANNSKKKVPPQSIQSPRKIQMIPVTKHSWKAIVLLQLNTMGCQQKEMGHKGGQR